MDFVRRMFVFVIAFAWLHVYDRSANATIVFTSHVKADFTFTTVGTTLNLPDGTVLPFTAFGDLTFTLEDSLLGPTVKDFTAATGTLTVASPVGFAGATMGPYSFVGGTLQNISYDGSGNVTRGDVTNLSMLWEMNLGPTRLYTKVALPFNGEVTGAPFVTGNVISGAAPFEVFLDTGNPATDPLVVIGQDRFLTITAVPEPSSLALLATFALGLAGRRFRRAKL